MKTVQILGKGRGIGPSFDPGIERWGINDLAFLRYSGKFTDWSRWFDLHPPDYIQTRRPLAWEWYKQQDKPIYMFDKHQDILASIQYPKDLISNHFRTKRFGSSFDWMCALAIFEKFERIEICWCRMNQTSEHQHQTPTANYWIGQAEARGIEIKIHGDSALHPPEKLYGCEIIHD